MFKTSFEIDQRWLLELAADRTPFIDQAQSLNLFIPADVDKWDLMMLHFRAWEQGIKSLYYLRSKSVQRAGLRRRSRGRQHARAARDPGAARRPTMTSAWHANDGTRTNLPPCGGGRWGAVGVCRPEESLVGGFVGWRR